MKPSRIITKSVSALIVAVLAIMAFARGPLQVWLYAASFTIWAGFAIITLARAYNERQKYVRRPEKRQGRSQVSKPVPFQVPEVEIKGSTVLMQHVNHRISSHLKSIYPDVTWEWVDASPERLVLQGGSGRIRVYNIADFNEAMVHFEDHAQLDFSMMRVVPLATLQGKEPANNERVPVAQPVDVSVWFDVSGRELLEDLVADLNSRGFSSVVIKDSGDVCVVQDDREVSQAKLENMPQRVHWPLLAKVLEKASLSAKVEDTGITVAW